MGFTLLLLLLLLLLPRLFSSLALAEKQLQVSLFSTSRKRFAYDGIEIKQDQRNLLTDFGRRKNVERFAVWLLVLFSYLAALGGKRNPLRAIIPIEPINLLKIKN